MCISHLGQKVTTWVSRDHGDHLGQTQVIASYYLGQSYHLGWNRNIDFSFVFQIIVRKSQFNLHTSPLLRSHCDFSTP